MNINEIRKKLSLAVLSRSEMLEHGKKECEKVAKNYFLGASVLAETIGEEKLSVELKSSYSVIVERGVGLVYKWAEKPVPQADNKEAA